MTGCCYRLAIDGGGRAALALRGLRRLPADRRTLIVWPQDDQGSAVAFNKAGDAIYVISSLDSDTTQLQLVSTADGTQVCCLLCADVVSRCRTHGRTVVWLLAPRAAQSHLPGG